MSYTSGQEVPPRVPQPRPRTSSSASATPAGPAGSRRALRAPTGARTRTCSAGADADLRPPARSTRRAQLQGRERPVGDAPVEGAARPVRARLTGVGEHRELRASRRRRARGWAEQRPQRGRTDSRPGGPEVKPPRSEVRPGPPGQPWGAGFSRAAAPHRGPRRGCLSSPDADVPSRAARRRP